MYCIMNKKIYYTESNTSNPYKYNIKENYHRCPEIPGYGDMIDEL